MFSFLVLYKSLQWNLYLRDGLFCLYIILVVGTVVLISENQNLILNAMGRSSDLSGRIELWESIIPMIKKRLFFGYGYNAFWIEGGAREYIRYLVEWDTPHSHNGILDVWLDIGLLGVFIFTLSFVQALLNSIKHIKQKNSWEALWPLIYLTFLLLSSFLESTGFVKHNNLYWVLYVSLIMSYYRGIS
jgi:O-antigen ligase